MRLSVDFPRKKSRKLFQGFMPFSPLHCQAVVEVLEIITTL